MRKTGLLSDAAAELEAELDRYQLTTSELAKAPITSDKTLQRARKMLEQCAEHQQKLALLLPALADAMTRIQEQQQTCMETTAHAAQRLKERFDARNALLERVAELGARAQEIQEPLASLIAGGARPKELLEPLDAVVERADKVIAEADTLKHAASDADWQDIARDVDALRQQLLAARNKILVARRNMAEA